MSRTGGGGKRNFPVNAKEKRKRGRSERGLAPREDLGGNAKPKQKQAKNQELAFGINSEKKGEIQPSRKS